MNKRLTEREQLRFKLDDLSETEIAEVLNYVTLIEAHEAKPVNAQSPLFAELGDDDTVVALSVAYENRRAQQVVEWEAIRRRAETMASAQHYARS